MSSRGYRAPTIRAMAFPGAGPAMPAAGRSPIPDIRTLRSRHRGIRVIREPRDGSVFDAPARPIVVNYGAAAAAATAATSPVQPVVPYPAQSPQPVVVPVAPTPPPERVPSRPPPRPFPMPTIVPEPPVGAEPRREPIAGTLPSLGPSALFGQPIGTLAR